MASITPAHLSLDPPEFHTRAFDCRSAFHPEAIHLARELVAEALEERRIHQPVLQCIEDPRLELVTPNVEPIAACPLVVRGRSRPRCTGRPMNSAAIILPPDSHAKYIFCFVRRICGRVGARVACRGRDRERFRRCGRYGSRRIFAW